MKASEVASGPVASLRAGTPAARADGAIGNYAPRFDREQIVSLIHPHRTDVDNVEHERQNRLTRWQKPPTPTRKTKVI